MLITVLHIMNDNINDITCLHHNYWYFTKCLILFYIYLLQDNFNNLN